MNPIKDAMFFYCVCALIIKMADILCDNFYLQKVYLTEKRMETSNKNLKINGK